MCISAGQVQVNINLLVGVFVLGFLELFGTFVLWSWKVLKSVLWKANYLGVSLCLTIGGYWFGEGQNTRAREVLPSCPKVLGA